MKIAEQIVKVTPKGGSGELILANIKKAYVYKFKFAINLLRNIPVFI